MIELRRTLRTLRASPGFTAAAVLSLSLSIGAVATLFSLLNEVAFRTLAAPEPHRLAAIFTVDPSGERDNFSYTELELLRERLTSFEALFAFDENAIRTLEIKGSTFAGNAIYASDGFAETMRIRPAIGRTIAAGETDVALLGYGQWQQHFQGGAAALGDIIRVQGRSFRVVGVLPREFTTMAATTGVDAVVPLAGMVPVARLRAFPDPAWAIVGRLKPGASLERARDELAATWPRLQVGSQRRIDIESAARGTGFHYTRQRFREPLRILLAISGLLLLLGAVNLATFLLARGDAERRAVAIRVALGANRRQIVALYAVEALVLAASGVAGGILCARWASRYFSSFVWVANLDRPHEVPMDASVFAIALVSGIAAALLFGGVPAFRALRSGPADALRGRRSRPILVPLQVALSLALVVTAAVFGGALRQYRAMPTGFDPRHLTGVSLMNRPNAYRGMDAIAYYSDLYRRVAAVRGVTVVGAANYPPAMPPVLPDQLVHAGSSSVPAQQLYVGPGYFPSLGMRLLSGREIDFRDDTQSPPVAVVSRALERRLFGNDSALGRTVRVGKSDLQVIGVAPDSRIGSLQRPNPFQIFVAKLQSPYPGQPYLLIRTAGPLGPTTLRDIRAAIEGLGREYPLRVESMDRILDRALNQERLLASLAMAFGVIALSLAAVGLGASMAYAVARRRREIGIRMALGARPANVAREFLRQAVVAALAGFSLGAPGAFWIWRAARSKVTGLGAPDAHAIALAAAILIATLAVAAGIPARRAARSDPASSLRSE